MHFLVFEAGSAARGKAVQVDSPIRLTLALKALGFQRFNPVESTSLS